MDPKHYKVFRGTVWNKITNNTNQWFSCFFWVDFLAACVFPLFLGIMADIKTAVGCTVSTIFIDSVVFSPRFVGYDDPIFDELAYVSNGLGTKTTRPIRHLQLDNRPNRVAGWEFLRWPGCCATSLLPRDMSGDPAGDRGRWCAGVSSQREASTRKPGRHKRANWVGMCGMKG